MEAWKSQEFVIFDLETTGLDVNQGDEIVEIGAIRFQGENYNDITSFETFVQPKTLIPKEATAINGITNEMVKNAPRIDEVFIPFMNFCKGAIPVAQNAKFDLSFLQPYIQKNEYMNFYTFCVDTKMISRKIWFYERGHNLDTIAARLGLTYNSKTRHRSIADCKITGECFIKMLKKINVLTMNELKKYSVPVSKPIILDQTSLPMFEF